MFSAPKICSIVIILAFSGFFLTGCAGSMKSKSFVGQTAASKRVTYYKQQYNVIKMGETIDDKNNIAGPADVDFSFENLD
jgi:PBP1b-binding outer membrane lipoprotein LpoB